MSSSGWIYPNTPDHSNLWWLAAEIIAGYDDTEKPEGEDPRILAATLYPTLHAHWMARIVEYAKRGLEEAL